MIKVGLIYRKTINFAEEEIIMVKIVIAVIIAVAVIGTVVVSRKKKG